MPTIHTSKSPAEVFAILSGLPQVLAGRAPDPHSIARGLALRIAVAFFELVSDAFIVKARGGVDDAGVKWPPLSRSYLAYGRSEGRALRWKDGRRIGTDVGGMAPGKHPDGRQYNGYMTSGELNQWYKIYRRNLARISKKEPGSIAKVLASKIAWAAMKRAGVKTKWDELGTRSVEILRDTGLLFNSLMPGVFSEAGPTANYSPPADQVCDFTPGKLVAGTHVEYAQYHQNASDTGRLRMLWPKSLPQLWKDHLTEQLKLGLIQIIVILIR